MNLSQFNAVLFDMDGVFVDTEPVVFGVTRQVFDPMGIHLTDEFQYNFIGHPTRQNLQMIEKEFQVSLEYDVVIRKLKQHYDAELSIHALPVTPGIPELVRFAKEQKLKTGLCTTSPQRDVNVIFSKLAQTDPLFRPDTLFDAIVTGDQIHLKKPNPEPYLMLTDRLNTQPQDCLVIEDSEPGVQSARAAGCTCLALRRFYNHHMDFTPADEIVEADDLLRWVAHHINSQI
ncbi:MAG: HAD family phosphatase [candidate division KSB1 bacterium]|nr:HAD family phosphatase [candidate division KSB1 bacterium]